MGDERSAPSQESAPHAPESSAPSEDLNVPDIHYLLASPAGVLTAQRLAGNEAIQRVLGPASLRDAVTVSRDGGQTVTGNPADSADPLTGGAGSVAYSYSKPATSGGTFEFNDPDYDSLMATLTARMGKEEIGHVKPTVTLTLNGISIPQDGTTVNVPDDNAPIKNGTFTVVDNITLPTWTNVGSPKVQDAQRKEWTRYASAVAAHEDLHAADDKGVYDPVGATLAQKPIGAAIDAVSQATTDANAKSAPRDASNPPPTLNPAGTSKVP